MAEAGAGGGPLYRRTLPLRAPVCATPTPRGTRRLRVLLVEDVPAARAFLAERLARCGVDVLGPAADGAQAAALARVLHPDVCVVDVAGASGAGLPALREVVAADPAVEVVACASSGTGRVAVEAIRCGARRVVTTLRELDAVVAAHQRAGGPPGAPAGPAPAPATCEGGWVGFGGIAERRHARKHPDPAAAADAEALRRLRRALDGEDGFVTFAEPVVELAGGVVCDHVVSVGLLGPDGTVAEADAFMPLARRFGLGAEVDGWTVREAARFAARGHRLQVDVSDESVADPGFGWRVESALMEARAPAGRLSLRIRESTLAGRERPTLELVRRLQSLGCRVVLRDFQGLWGDPARIAVAAVAVDAAPARPGVVQDLADQGVGVIAGGLADDGAVLRARALGVGHGHGPALGRRILLEELAGRVAVGAWAPAAATPVAHR